MLRRHLPTASENHYSKTSFTLPIEKRKINVGLFQCLYLVVSYSYSKCKQKRYWIEIKVRSFSRRCHLIMWIRFKSEWNLYIFQCVLLAKVRLSFVHELCIYWFYAKSDNRWKWYVFSSFDAFSPQKEQITGTHHNIQVLFMVIFI